MPTHKLKSAIGLLLGMIISYCFRLISSTGLFIIIIFASVYVYYYGLNIFHFISDKYFKSALSLEEQDGLKCLISLAIVPSIYFLIEKLGDKKIGTEVPKLENHMINKSSIFFR